MRTDYLDNDPHPSSSSSSYRAGWTSTSNGSSSRRNKTTENGNSNSNNENMYSSSVHLRSGVPPDYFGHNREEITRILIQALGDMGYSEAAQIVSQQSGYEVESPDVAAFRAAVLEGKWDRAEKLLWGQGGGGRGGLVLAPGADRNAMRFRLRQQKYLELLEQGNRSKALGVLRNELTPLCHDSPSQILSSLSRYLMCEDANDLRNKAAWDGAQGLSRRLLLSQLSECISPSVMLPEKRLAVLLDDVKNNQIEKCLYHTTTDPPSLYADHECERCQFPTDVMLELDKQQGELWQIRFSPNGERLATCGSGKGVCIWDTRTFHLVRVLGHDVEVSNIAWSPDSSMLVSCSMDGQAKVWNTQTGDLIKALEKFGEPVSSAGWLPDGKTFVTGSLDKTKSLCEWDLSGSLLYNWTKRHRTEDLAVSADGHWMVAMDDQCTVHVYNIPRREYDGELAHDSRLTSVSLSQDSKWMLVNTVEDEALLYDMDTREVVKKFKGHTGGETIIRAGFGGANENFVISGSEDGNVFVWNRTMGQLVHKKEAHTPRVNSACWNPRDPGMYATCGDEGRVKIWTNAERARNWAMAKSRIDPEKQTQGQRFSTNGTSGGGPANGWGAGGGAGAAGGFGGGNEEEDEEEEEQGDGEEPPAEGNERWRRAADLD